MATAFADANTVGDLLNRFIVNALEHSSSTRFFVRTEGDRSTFGFRRLAAPSVVPAHNDAFYLGLLIRVMAKATRDQWNPAAVLFRVADPDAIPPLPESIRITKGDSLGMQIKFPSTWLFERIEKTIFLRATSEPNNTNLPKSTKHSFKNLKNPSLTSRSTLRRLLYGKEFE